MKWQDILNFNILSSTLCLINVPDAQKKFQTYLVKKTKKFFTYHFSFIIRMEQDFYISFFESRKGETIYENII